MPSFKNAAATLPAKDLARAREFYEGTLGLQAEEENPGGVMYGAGSGLVFVYPSEFAGTNEATAATFEVEDVRATVEELRGKGVEFHEYDMPMMKTEDGIANLGGDLGAWFTDPEGNILAVIQRGA
jgi:catechol 2,3-dioxygenase-like lactoylglutathione lyase family enzyme